MTEGTPMSVTPREEITIGPPVIEPFVVGWLTHDGKLTLRDCSVCPARDVLCGECIVPDLITVELTDAGRAALGDG
jgi:hypothetical protein